MNLRDYISYAINEPPNAESVGEVENEFWDTKYVMYWTSEEIVSLLAASIIRSPLDALFPLPPASTFIVEIWEAPDGPWPWDEGWYIRAYIND